MLTRNDMRLTTLARYASAGQTRYTPVVPVCFASSVSVLGRTSRVQPPGDRGELRPGTRPSKLVHVGSQRGERAEQEREVAIARERVGETRRTRRVDVPLAIVGRNVFNMHEA